MAVSTGGSPGRPRSPPQLDSTKLGTQLRRSAIQLLRRFHPRFGLRSTDVLLASFPKSGNTWVRFLWANVVALTELDGRTVDFHVLRRDLGAEYDEHRYGDVEFDCLPRLVKTHQPYTEAAFGDNRSVYLYRHPGDVMVSYHQYLRGRVAGPEVPEELGAFLRDEEHGLPAWCRHVVRWREHADVALSYADLQEDVTLAMGRVFGELGIERISPSVLKGAARRSSFGRMRRLEEDRGRPREGEFRDGFRFMRSGRTCS